MPYIPYTWNIGDTISPARLNNLEAIALELPKADSIATPMIKANAVTDSTRAAVTGTAMSTTSASYVDMHASLSISVTINTAGGAILVFLNAGPSEAGGGSVNGMLGVNINGTDYDVAGFYQNNAGQYTCTGLSGVMSIKGLAAGTYTIKARMKRVGGATAFIPVSGFSSAQHASLSVIKLER